jgi:putative acyl-CoA dehydrogenase
VLDDIVQEVAGLPGASEAVSFIRTAIASTDAESMARAAVGRLALLAAAAALCESAPTVAPLFARTWLLGRHDTLVGTSDIAAKDAELLTDRALPEG